MNPPQTDPSLTRFLEDLSVERQSASRHAGDDHFVGNAQPASDGHLFGGFVFAQAMRAAEGTVDGFSVHSAHAYFLRAGDPTKPIEYAVERIRDGRSFVTRRVVAHQGDKAIFNLSTSFQKPDDSPGRQVDVEIPAEIEGEALEEIIVRGLNEVGEPISLEEFGHYPVEVRAIGGLSMTRNDPIREPKFDSWFRARGPVPDEPGLHQAFLAYASDHAMLVAAQHPMPWGMMDAGMRPASLDHAIWFHDSFRVDDWIFAVHDSPVMKRSRPIGRVAFYTRDGRLVASAVQEGLIRPRA